MRDEQVPVALGLGACCALALPRALRFHAAAAAAAAAAAGAVFVVVVAAAAVIVVVAQQLLLRVERHLQR